MQNQSPQSLGNKLWKYLTKKKKYVELNDKQIALADRKFITKKTVHRNFAVKGSHMSAV